MNINQDNYWYLIQRASMRDAKAQEAMKNAGKTGVDVLLQFDYMGAAEFEFGALGKTFKKFRELGETFKLQRFHTPYRSLKTGKCFQVIAEDTLNPAVICEQIERLGKGEIRTKEATYLDAHFKKDAWTPSKVIDTWISVINPDEPAVLWTLDSDFCDALMKELRRGAFE